MRPILLMGMLTLATASSPGVARAWDPFTRQNAHVEDGNRLLARGDAQGALREYDLAAREHPSAPEVQLDRGLALLRLTQHGKAREAFLRATEPPAASEIRASAYHDLALSFYQEADQLASTDQERAQGLFREAADACRRSLRIRPGARDTAWNLELAMRRIREIEEEQRRQEEQRQQEQQQQEQQQQEQQQQDQQQQEQQQQDQQQQEQQQQDQQQQDQQQQNQQQQDQAQNQQDQQQQDQQQQDQQAQNQQNQNQQNQQQNGQPQNQNGGQSPSEARAAEERAEAAPVDNAEAAPEHLRRLLDAIEGGEESLERQRARLRSAREGRRPTQDW